MLIAKLMDHWDPFYCCVILCLLFVTMLSTHYTDCVSTRWAYLVVLPCVHSQYATLLPETQTSQSSWSIKYFQSSCQLSFWPLSDRKATIVMLHSIAVSLALQSVFPFSLWLNHTHTPNLHSHTCRQRCSFTQFCATPSRKTCKKVLHFVPQHLCSSSTAHLPSLWREITMHVVKSAILFSPAHTHTHTHTHMLAFHCYFLSVVVCWNCSCCRCSCSTGFCWFK